MSFTASAARKPTLNGDAPCLYLPRADFTRPDIALDREWLVSNGIGGFASGTVAQANTRRYHGLLMASLRPPVDRVLMVAKVDITLRVDGRATALGCNEYADGTLAPRGQEHLVRFHLEAGIPTWLYMVGGVQIEQQIWMAQGRNATYLRLRLLASDRPVELELLPLCTYRDYHAHGGGGWHLDVAAGASYMKISAFDGALPYYLSVDRGRAVPGSEWYWRFRHRAESARGLDDTEDLFVPGRFLVPLTAGESVTFVASAEAGDEADPTLSLATETARRRGLLSALSAQAPEWIRHLTLAADTFVVARGKRPDGGRSIVAGYPWFGDWGRDTMIALPGLTLVTGRPEEAAAILRTFARHVSEGMLPNRFPDDGEQPEYNTVDASLWYFHAIDAYHRATGDLELVRELFPTLEDMIAWHRSGTRYGIRVDAADGLLAAGVPGVQLTWMDAKIGDWVVTPRIGKPVEINALWHFALEAMENWARELRKRPIADLYAAEASRVAESFRASFWSEDLGCLHDVVDGPVGATDPAQRRVDSSIRPNQIFAVSLGSALLGEREARAVVDTCTRELLTPVGLRSLSPGHPHYAGRYEGGPRDRDAVYHQGTVWSWLLGPYAIAHYRVYRDAAHAHAVLAAIAPHLGEACLGSISEIFDGDAPHAPRGCFAQAWSVAEILRAWHEISSASAGSGSRSARSKPKSGE